MKLTSRKLNSNQTKWMLRLFPPFLLGGVWCRYITPDFKKCEVVVHKYLLNRNLTGTIFGGTIFSAGDPFQAIMLWQIFTNKGYKVESWLKSASINYIKPASSDLIITFEISDNQIDEFENGLKTKGKHSHKFHFDIQGKSGQTIAKMTAEAYLRIIK
ncbi:MAG: acyl-coenzyme A thioesterase PaaI-like protein [Sphingobacteriales bacterium]|jgi:acyl-coenzyme A thioesterase PaaI-like protein